MKKIIISILCLSIIIIPLNTHATTLKEYEDAVAKYTKELKDHQANLAKSKEEVAQVKANISKIEGQIKDAEEQIESLQKEIDDSNKKIKQKTKESKKIIEYYQISNGENSYLEYIFGATSITDMIYRMSVVEQLTEYNDNLMKELNHSSQMKDVWTTPTINNYERRFGRHPTQKPLSVIDRMVKASTDSGMILLDPFVGSGTTAVAGARNGIRTIGIDNSQDYLNIAIKRVSDLQEEKLGKIK